MNSIKLNKLDIFAKEFIESIPSDNWVKASKYEIEISDGRRDKSNPISQCGSIIYIAYADKNILYVGESSTSIKRRFISDGSGSHKEANKTWYKNMTHVKFLKYEESILPEMYRKLLEQLFSVNLKPENYGKKT